MKVYKDFDEFINSGLDGVVLCNYFHEHAKYAIKAFEAGVAVLCETTAAASLGECVDLVEAAERTNAKYMLAANSPYYRGVHAMKERIEKEVFGKVIYADAEYIHPAGGMSKDAEMDYDNLHWRMTLPSCYYNMHTLGPLMYLTNTVPVKVVCKSAKADLTYKITDCVKTFTITEMDNGAVFNSTGVVDVGSSGKWFRIACENGTLETARYDQAGTKLVEVNHDSKEIKTLEFTWATCGDLTPEEDAKYGGLIGGKGHGGMDFILLYRFIKFLRGEEKPFFDVYRSVALSAAGILAWYSSLSDSKEYVIPDFKKKEDRDKVRGDYRTPFAKKYSDLTLPCKVDGKLADLK